MTIASGTKLGRYDVRSHLGAGAMGEVYLAQDTVLGRRVALKILARVLADADRMWLKVESQFDPLRSDPRFQQLLQKIGFP